MKLKVNIDNDVLIKIEDMVKETKETISEFYTDNKNEDQIFNKIDIINKNFCKIALKTVSGHFYTEMIYQSFTDNDSVTELTVNCDNINIQDICLQYCIFLYKLGAEPLMLYTQDYIFAGIRLYNTETINGCGILYDEKDLKNIANSSYDNIGNIFFMDLADITQKKSVYSGRTKIIEMLKNIKLVVDFSAYGKTINENFIFGKYIEKKDDVENIKDIVVNIEENAVADELSLKELYKKGFQKNGYESYDLRNSLETVHFFKEDMQPFDCQVSDLLLKIENSIFSIETNNTNTQYVLACDVSVSKLLNKKRSLIICSDDAVEKIYNKLNNFEFADYIFFTDSKYVCTKKELKEEIVYTEDGINQLKENFRRAAIQQERLEEGISKYGKTIKEIFDGYVKSGEPENIETVMYGEYFIDVNVLHSIHKYKKIFDSFYKDNFINFLVYDNEKIKTLKNLLYDEKNTYQEFLDTKDELVKIISEKEGYRLDTKKIDDYRRIAFNICKEIDETKKSNNFRTDSLEQIKKIYSDNEEIQFYLKYMEFVKNKLTAEEKMEKYNKDILNKILAENIEELKQYADVFSKNDYINNLGLNKKRKNAINYFRNILLRVSKEDEISKESKFDKDENFGKLKSLRKVIEEEVSTNENSFIEKISNFTNKIFYKEDNFDEDDEICVLTDIIYSFYYAKQYAKTINKNYNVTFDEIYKFFGENVYYESFNLQLQSIQLYKELGCELNTLKEIMYLSAKKGSTIQDNPIIEIINKLVNYILELERKMNEVLNFTGYTHKEYNVKQEKELIHKCCENTLSLISEQWENYINYSNDIIQANMEEFLNVITFENYQSVCNDMEKFWYKNNAFFCSKTENINIEHYKFYYDRYMKLHNSLRNVAIKQIHNNIKNEEGSFIVVSTVKDIERWLKNRESIFFDSIIVCNADRLNNDDIVSVLSCGGKLFLLYEKSEENIGTVKEHSKKFKFPELKYSDYISYSEE